MAAAMEVPQTDMPYPGAADGVGWAAPSPPYRERPQGPSWLHTPLEPTAKQKGLVCRGREACLPAAVPAVARVCKQLSTLLTGITNPEATGLGFFWNVVKNHIKGAFHQSLIVTSGHFQKSSNTYLAPKLPIGTLLICVHTHAVVCTHRAGEGRTDGWTCAYLPRSEHHVKMISAGPSHVLNINCTSAAACPRRWGWDRHSTAMRNRGHTDAPPLLSAAPREHPRSQ